MYNEYIYEKKLKEEQLKELENEKMIKYRKLHIKKREKLSNKYYQKIERFVMEALSDLESQFIKNNYFSKTKNNAKNKTDNTKQIIKKKKIINKRILSFNPLDTNKHKKEKEIHNPIKIFDNNTFNNTFTCFELPKMRFGIKNDLERIREDIYKRDGKLIDEKLLKNLNKKFIKQINKQKFDYLKIKKNNSISINNNMNPLNKSENLVIKRMNSPDKKDENLEKNKIFKNRILNSKLIKSITFNEKYNNSFYKSLTFSLLKNKNITISNKIKFNRLKNLLTPTQIKHPILNKKEKKERKILSPVNSINFYRTDDKEFLKFNKHINDINKSEEKFGESSDSSVNDNGQEEVQKKLITLNYPVLKETVKEKDDNKKNLIYLKKIIDEGVKEEEHPKKIFVHKNSVYINFYSDRRMSQFDKMKKYIFLKGKKKFKLVE